MLYNVCEEPDNDPNILTLYGGETEQDIFKVVGKVQKFDTAGLSALLDSIPVEIKIMFCLDNEYHILGPYSRSLQ